jgi:hypothetical protein
MLKRSAFALALIAGFTTAAYSETFLATITKVDGSKVTFKKATYHRGKGGAEKYTLDEPVTAEVTKDAAVTRGHFLPADGPTATAGRMTAKPVPLKGALDHEAFKNINAGKTSRPSLITIADRGDDKGKITAINLWASGAPK